MKLIALALLAVTALRIPAAPPTPEDEIKAVLYRQQAAWNRGDTETFLQGYASDTIFVGDTITRGLDEVRVRYQTRYPTISSMGHLTFSDLEVHLLGVTSAYVIGRWRLERPAANGGDVGGVYTMVFRKTAKGWKIIVDHTS
ncbi:MAG TPA: DUF4440 domain-containing protein [Bryobacteraceae bacterium]|nr:DUF4440 domain-containing protein [Bryobacteraceae bacterium]